MILAIEHYGQLGHGDRKKAENGYDTGLTQTEVEGAAVPIPGQVHTEAREGGTRRGQFTLREEIRHSHLFLLFHCSKADE